jgi:hypothetical protein
MDVWLKVLIPLGRERAPSRVTAFVIAMLIAGEAGFAEGIALMGGSPHELWTLS